jgi:hypothetical protein
MVQAKRNFATKIDRVLDCFWFFRKEEALNLNKWIQLTSKIQTIRWTRPFLLAVLEWSSILNGRFKTIKWSKPDQKLVYPRWPSIKKQAFCLLAWTMLYVKGYKNFFFYFTVLTGINHSKSGQLVRMASLA